MTTEYPAMSSVTVYTDFSTKGGRTSFYVGKDEGKHGSESTTEVSCSMITSFYVLRNNVSFRPTPTREKSWLSSELSSVSLVPPSKLILS